MQKTQVYDNFAYRVEFETRVIFKGSDDPISTFDQKKWCYQQVRIFYVPEVDDIHDALWAYLLGYPPEEFLDVINPDKTLGPIYGWADLELEATITAIFQEFEEKIYPGNIPKFEPIRCLVE